MEFLEEADKVNLRVYTGGNVIGTMTETYFANLKVVNLHGVSHLKAFCKDRKFIFKYVYLEGRCRTYVLGDLILGT